MVSPAQAKANVATATALLARQLGFYSNTGAGFSYGDLSPSQQIALTNALAGYIKANPALFDTGAADLTNPVVSADYAQNQQQDAADPLGTFIDSATATARSLNPLDPANIATVGKWLLLAVVVLGAFWIFLKTPPRGGSTARA